MATIQATRGAMLTTLETLRAQAERLLSDREAMQGPATATGRAVYALLETLTEAEHRIMAIESEGEARQRQVAEAGLAADPVLRERLGLPRA